MLTPRSAGQALAQASPGALGAPRRSQYRRPLSQVRLTTKTTIRKPDGSYESRETIEYAGPACPLGAIANIFRHGEPGVDEHASTRRWAAPWAPSTGSPILISQPRFSCCGGRRLHRRTRDPADLTSALSCVSFPACQQTGDHSGLASKLIPLMPNSGRFSARCGLLLPSGRCRTAPPVAVLDRGAGTTGHLPAGVATTV